MRPSSSVPSTKSRRPPVDWSTSSPPPLRRVTATWRRAEHASAPRIATRGRPSRTPDGSVAANLGNCDARDARVTLHVTPYVTPRHYAELYEGGRAAAGASRKGSTYDNGALPVAPCGIRQLRI